jgi:hypothetical protein
MIDYYSSQSALGGPLRKRSPVLDRADPWIPCRRRGKRLHHGGDVCGIVMLVVDSTLAMEQEFFVPAQTLIGIILLRTEFPGKFLQQMMNIEKFWNMCNDIIVII